MEFSLKRKRDASDENAPNTSRPSPSSYDFPLGPAFYEQHGAQGSNGHRSATTSPDTRLSHKLAQPQRPQSHQRHLQIDYLNRQSPADLQLLEPTTDNLPDCVDLVNQYNSVLERSESLANNLGARPLSSILLQRFERMFDGPPRVVSYPQNTTIAQRPSISWLDVAAASDDPSNSTHDWQDSNYGGKRVVQFQAKGCTVEVSWEEWQMIKSGLVQKMMPSQPVAEDEEKELGALDIVEETVLRVVNLADQVAARGRQLNHRLRGRRTAIQDRRAADGRANGSNGWTPHNPSSTSSQVRQELTRLFAANRVLHARTNIASPPTHSGRTPSKEVPPTATTSHSAQSPVVTATPSNPSKPRRMPAPPAPEGPFKMLMSQRMEMLQRGARICPPCDRCRRLHMECTKNLTACSGCTKKHCKCSWRQVTEDEMKNGMINNQGNGVATGLSAIGEAPRWDDVGKDDTPHGQSDETGSVSGVDVGNDENPTHANSDQPGSTSSLHEGSVPRDLTLG